MPNLLTTSRGSLWRRFWAKVQYSPGCWEWQGSTNQHGYGRLRVNAATPLGYAHRVSYALANGVEPGDQCVLHHCDNPGCVNSDHLYLGDQADNARDRVERDRHARGEAANRGGLTERDVRAIRQAVASGAMQKDVAARYGVSPMCVSQVVRRKTWSHVA